MAAVSEEAKQHQREYNKQYRAANKEKMREINQRNNKARVARYRARHHERCLQSQAEYYDRNKDSILAWQKHYRDTTDGHKLANAKWEAANRHIKRAISAHRRAKLRRASVGWANHSTIKQMYATAEQQSIDTGVLHVVDHIIPLSNKLVCGLHCEANLRVITALDNGRKGNKLLLEFREPTT